MTPREVMPADVSEETEKEVWEAFKKMVDDIRVYERRYSTPNPRIEALEAALLKILSKCSWHKNRVWCDSPDCHCIIAVYALEVKDA